MSRSRRSWESAPTPPRKLSEMCPLLACDTCSADLRPAWSPSSSRCRRSAVKGFYLALTTLAAQVMFPIIVLALPSDWLGGTSGMAVEPIRDRRALLSTPLDMYYFTLAGALMCSIGAFNLQRSRFGRALSPCATTSIAAEVTGVNVSYYKVDGLLRRFAVRRRRRRLLCLLYPLCRRPRISICCCRSGISGC